MKRLPVAVFALFCLITPLRADDWPMWRCDAGRTASTAEQLPSDLHLQWSWKLPPLQPAWAEDPRLQFDASYEPIVLGKTMFLASSRNDSVTALDTERQHVVAHRATGLGQWGFDGHDQEQLCQGHRHPCFPAGPHHPA